MSATRSMFGCSATEDPVDQVSGRRTQRFGVGGAAEAPAVGALEPRLAHQPGDPLAAMAVAVGPELGVEAGGGVGAAAHLMDAAKPLGLLGGDEPVQAHRVVSVAKKAAAFFRISRSSRAPCFRGEAGSARRAHPR
jgi:hypothetical protein